MPQTSLHHCGFFGPVNGHGADHVNGVKVNPQLIRQIGDTIPGGSGGYAEENFGIDKAVPNLGAGFVDIRHNAVFL
ncbi:hypothetical protein D3C75_1136040 [compost metagenome]